MEDFEQEYDDCPYHAPTEFVARMRELRVERKRRDRNELQDVRREEMRARKREHAAMFTRGAR